MSNKGTRVRAMTLGEILSDYGALSNSNLDKVLVTAKSEVFKVGPRQTAVFVNKNTPLGSLVRAKGVGANLFLFTPVEDKANTYVVSNY